MRALLIGESWTTHMIHQKGFDSFTTTEYVEGGQEFAAALRDVGWEVTHIPAQLIETQLPPDTEFPREFDVVVISDVGVNSFLLTRGVFARSVSEPNRLEAIREYVLAGGGLVMVGGYLSFSGIDAKARYADSPLAELLPVEMLRTDDRVECPQGVEPEVVRHDHPAVAAVEGSWPAVLGYNKTVAKDAAETLVRIAGDPLVAVGSAGRGRTAVFTSDMSPHWAPPEFMEWSGYGPLWHGLLEWTAGGRAG